MNESPEGLSYNHPEKCYKNVGESILEKGKYDSARHSGYAKEHDGAESLRMKDGGSMDPMYHDKHKNK